MRAIVIRKFGHPIEAADMPIPEPDAGSVQVRLEAAGVNPLDRRMATGFLEGELPQDFPMILGVDGAGTVSAVGIEVTHFAVGDRVVGRFPVPPEGHGSFAEYSVLPENATIVRIPSAISTLAAAALPTEGVTAQNMVDAAAIEPGQRVLIVGAADGVGAFLVQLANIAGARVIATARADYADTMVRLGAEETVDHSRASIADSVRFTHPDGVDVLFDLVSPPDELAELTGLVREGGAVFSTIGAADGARPRPRLIRGGNIESRGGARELARLLHRVAAGDVVVPVAATVPLAAAPSVIGVSGARGKTVLAI